MRLVEFLEKNHLLENAFRGVGRDGTGRDGGGVGTSGAERWRDKILAASRISNLEDIYPYKIH